ncbi:hypothetical protein TRIP_B50693 [uncultured Desulfatiglans sp.]|uniref:Uncharacterized protein n=1 Tax=Uncultured Desulfatiglans sp. TaxID=1748965 RepID=A0A653AIM9_UNCDX|nr:hypothetical protein TRIP_B50693 [uncultured Desulfatiglans sp.]
MRNLLMKRKKRADNSAVKMNIPTIPATIGSQYPDRFICTMPYQMEITDRVSRYSKAKDNAPVRSAKEYLITAERFTI